MATKRRKSGNDRLAAIRDKLKNTDLGGGRGGFWSPKVGKNTIRIMPEVHDMNFFFQTVGKHEFPPDRKRHVYCPKFTSEGELDCPVCELIDDLYKAGDKASKQLASALYVRKSYWMNVINREDEDTGPQIFTPGVTIFNALVGIINDPDYGDITDPDNGFDITIERSGTGLETEYQVRARPRTSPLSDDQDTLEKWLEEAPDLSYVEVSENQDEDKEISKGHAIYVLPFNRIVDEFDLETIDADEDDEEIEDAVEDDEDEEYDDEDDEELEEEAPAKKEVKRRRAARPSRRR